ncbi:LOW QUALITY PROTEIN: hypothetical protein PanWU01x14_250970 [Parasponia andersonii]|uniref:Uncharacterized protein n=1 Tax=Parasponia andersonii TaxID=3476 RepID=A0A2P5BCQ1_PARAD|nr:LOW QUALITY PROTEIN: hypothetical protein PanWU01x14_250970 [Parasponia andersonii]
MAISAHICLQHSYNRVFPYKVTLFTIKVRELRKSYNINAGGSFKLAHNYLNVHMLKRLPQRLNWDLTSYELSIDTVVTR